MTDNSLPDEMKRNIDHTAAKLQWVGMEGIAVPLTLDMANRVIDSVVASADVYVSLDAEDTKGIHMSRIYNKLNQLECLAVNRLSLQQLQREIVEEQEGRSLNCRLVLAFSWMVKKKALRSERFGFQQYDVKLQSTYVGGHFQTKLSLEIPYSSTCPCSAALARQSVANAIEREFTGDEIGKETLLQWLVSENGTVATPHSQRSVASIDMVLKEPYQLDLTQLIEEIENAIGTPVQTAVKREDEQAFAELNAKNLMFCEDAARKLNGTLLAMDGLEDFWFKIDHQESLHPHNAVVLHRKK